MTSHEIMYHSRYIQTRADFEYVMSHEESTKRVQDMLLKYQKRDDYHTPRSRSCPNPNRHRKHHKYGKVKKMKCHPKEDRYLACPICRIASRTVRQWEIHLLTAPHKQAKQRAEKFVDLDYLYV